MAKRKSAAPKPVKTQAPDPNRERREAKILQFKLVAGYGIIGLCVVGALLSAFGPRSLGLPGVPPTAAIGVSLLALLRLGALRQEQRRQTASAD